MTDWPVKTLGEVCEVLDSLRKPITKRDRTSGDYPYYGATGIVDYVSDYIFDERLVLVGEDGAKWGAGERTAFIAEGKYWVNNHAHVLRCKQGVLVDSWLANFLTMSDLNRYVSGLTVPKLNQGSLVSIEIPVPPLEEQKRIVELLDAATARVTELTACYQQARTYANNLFTSALRETLASNPDWPVKTLGSIFRVCSSKRVLKSEWKQSGVPFYRGREITALSKHGFVQNELFISEEHFSDLVQKYGVPKIGDIMITAIGTIGNSYVVKEADRFYFKDASVIWLDKQTEIMSSYVQYWIMSSRFRDQLNAGNGATVDTLTIDGLSKMQIPVPSLEEQKRIVARLDEMKAKTSEMVAAYDAKLTAAMNLRQSILEAAFAGDM